MAATYTSRPLSIGYGTRLIAATTNLTGMFAHWNNLRKTQKVLNRLSDYELEDIGLSRGDIQNIGR